jgi:hypothetical protein
MIDEIDKLLEDGQRPHKIYEQASLSTFGITSKFKPESQDLVDLLVKQKSLLNQIVKQERTSFQLIINPPRNFILPYMGVCIDSLLEWMTDPEIINNPRIQFVETTFMRHNRLIVSDEFYIEGQKIRDRLGYDISKVVREKRKIEEAIIAFGEDFSHAHNKRKESVIDGLRDLRNTLKIEQAVDEQ